MECPECGYQLQPFDKECPKCARLAAQGKNVPQRAAQAGAPASGQWMCHSCGTFNPGLKGACERCGTPRVSRDEEAGEGSPIVRAIVGVVVFLIVVVAVIFFNPTTRGYLSPKPRIVYTGTLDTADGPVVMVGVVMRSLDNAESVARQLAPAAVPDGKFSSVQIAFYTPMGVPSRNRYGRRDNRIYVDIIRGNTLIYGYTSDGVLTKRAQGERLQYTPREGEERVNDLVE